jgi:hypothetical protein
MFLLGTAWWEIMIHATETSGLENWSAMQDVIQWRMS